MLKTTDYLWNTLCVDTTAAAATLTLVFLDTHRVYNFWFQLHHNKKWQYGYI